MRIISFYTEGTPYQIEANRLKKSLDIIKVPYDIVPVQSHGSWAKNCQIKSEIIKNALLKLPDGEVLIYTDADSELLSYPALFEKEIDWDIAYYYMIHRSEMLSGTLGFRNSPQIRKLIDLWIKKNMTNSEWDQKNLQSVYMESSTDLKLRELRLPASYCFIYDNRIQMDEMKEEKPVFIHHQASRRFKRVIH